MKYVPAPLNTELIVMPDTLKQLMERLAENAHDVWAAQRAAEGWTYGPQRDDTRKQHPCLVPYADLPESEKNYDRSSVEQTIKAVLALGYTIAPPQQE